MKMKSERLRHAEAEIHTPEGPCAMSDRLHCHLGAHDAGEVLLDVWRADRHVRDCDRRTDAREDDEPARRQSPVRRRRGGSILNPVQGTDDPCRSAMRAAASRQNGGTNDPPQAPRHEYAPQGEREAQLTESIRFKPRTRARRQISAISSTRSEARLIWNVSSTRGSLRSSSISTQEMRQR